MKKSLWAHKSVLCKSVVWTPSASVLLTGLVEMKIPRHTLGLLNQGKVQESIIFQGVVLQRSSINIGGFVLNAIPGPTPKLWNQPAF